ncbi:MAG: UDP-3-O-(3-hydroxymyristoyl)glucosamine N-acyltransferase [Deltaproteobacteria bacterium]|nr:UDP-3-O-(3-hydroxymyristoyl)glucosamine N-acyltransferase [Deltaproteobacteria bacterium]
MRLDELAEKLGAELEGDPAIEITGVAPVETAGPTDLAFVSSLKYRRMLRSSSAGAVLVDRSVELEGLQLLRCDNPQLVFAAAIGLFDDRPQPVEGVHPSAVVADTVRLGEGAYVGPFAVLGENVVLGPGARIHPHVVIYPEVKAGRNFTAHAGVVVRERVLLGDDVTLQPGVVLGGDGFGFLPTGQGVALSVPQAGTVEIGDSVDLGANTTVDRAAVGVTTLGDGVKLDNLVMIAHGCELGDHTILAAQTGVAGSTRLGAGVMTGGQCGFGGHLEIGAGVQCAGQTGVLGDVESGEIVAGTPAVNIGLWRRCSVLLKRLPELFKRVARLEKALETGSDEKN